MDVEISIIIPVYNAEPYLRQCLDSVLAQSFTDYELILIDDCSKDGSGGICDEYSMTDNRVNVYHLPANVGAGAARNFGLSKAIGRYIGFIDADDWIEPKMFELLHKAAQENLADLTLCDYFAETASGSTPEASYSKEKGYFGRRDIETLFLPYFFGYKDCELKNYKDHCPFADYHSYIYLGLFKSSVISEHGIKFKDEKKYFNEDNLFNLEFLTYASCAFHLNANLYHHRISDSSLSSSFKERYYEMKVAKLAYLEMIISETSLGEEFQRRLLNKTAIDAVSIINYYGSSQLSLHEKRSWVMRIAGDPMISRSIRQFRCGNLRFSKLSIFLLLLKAHAYFAIAAASGIYARLRRNC